MGVRTLLLLLLQLLQVHAQPTEVLLACCNLLLRVGLAVAVNGHRLCTTNACTVQLFSSVVYGQ